MRKHVLVSIDHADGTAAMLRSRNGVRLTAGRRYGGGTLVDDERPCVQGLGEERTVLGGRLPHGAVRAVVVDSSGGEREAAVGDGAWIMVLDEPLDNADPPVRYIAADGRIVPTRLPEDWPRAPITDAITSCPACAAIEWDAVQARGESRGGSTDSHGNYTSAKIASCRVCGHELRVDGFYRLEVDQDHPGAHIETAAREAERRAQDMRLLAAVNFPVYVFASGPTPRAESLGGGTPLYDAMRGGPSHVRVHHDDGDHRLLSVETISDPDDSSPEELARDAIRNLMDRTAERWPELSEPALSLWLDERERDLSRSVLDARRSTEKIEVDGTPQSFTCLSLDRRWAAAAGICDLTVVILSRGVPLSATRLTSVPATTVALDY